MNKTFQTSLAALAAVVNLHAQESYDMGAITISSATKSEQSIKDVTSSVEVITAADLQEKQLTSVVEALNLVSGINFSSNGGLGATTSINLRGSSNNRVLILIDGVKFKDHSSMSGTNISHLMTNDIEKIEIIKGAQSGIWGADASAGVINIITKKAKEGINGYMGFETGSFDTKKHSIGLSHKDKYYDINLSAQRLKTESFTTMAPRGEDIKQYEDDGYTNKSLNLKSNIYFTDSSKLKLYFTKIDALKEYDSSGPNDDTMESDEDSRIYSFAFNQKFNNHDIQLKYENTNIKRDQIGTTWGVKLTDNTNRNLELMDTVFYNEEDFILAGAGRSSDKMDFTRADFTSSAAKNEANYLYLTNSNKFNKLILTESLRYDDHKNFDSKTTGKIGLKYNFSNDINIFANAGTSYSVPLLVQNINPWGNINMDIRPEKSRSYDMGFEYKSVKVTYFYQKVKDLIDWYDPDGWLGPIPAVYRNLEGKAAFEGLELDYKQDITDNIFFNMNYTYLDARDEQDKKLARRPKQTLKFGVDYYGIDKLHLGLNGEYVGTRYDNDDKQGEQTGRYTVANFVVDYRLSRQIKLYARCENITDKYYQTVDGYATSPRAYYAGIKVEF
jgi:vitamin B12 transporter